MTSYLYSHKVRIFDYTRFAEPFRNELRENAERLAPEHGLKIDHIRKRNFRKESHIGKVLARRGDQPGLVWIFSAMEPCATYKPWYSKETGKTYLVPDEASVCTTISISSTRNWGWVTCASPPGCLAGCRCISTGTIGWRRN